MLNAEAREVGVTPKAIILVSTDETDPVSFTVTRTTSDGEENTMYTAEYGVTTRVEFNLDEVAVENVQQRRKAVKVQAETNKTISVHGVNDVRASTDGFVAIPCDALAASKYKNYQYGILSTAQRGIASNPQTSSEFLIVTCEDATTITVTPSVSLSISAPGFDLGAFGPGNPVSERDWDSINAGETLLISLSLDLTGTRVKSNQPFLVFSGHQCGEVPSGTPPCDHMVEQLPPHFTWGYTHFLTPLAARESGDIYRVLTVNDNTEINVTCVNEDNSGSPETQRLKTLNRTIRENWLEYRTQKPNSEPCLQSFVRKFCCLQASNPVLVAQYSSSHTVDDTCVAENFGKSDLGDPFMSLVAPVEQYLNNYTIRAISAIAGSFPTQYIGISVHKRFFQPNQIMVNGTAMESNPSMWTNIYCEDGEMCGYSITRPIANNGDLTVYHEMRTAAINVHVYGFQTENSYAIVGGMELEPISGENQPIQ